MKHTSQNSRLLNEVVDDLAIIPKSTFAYFRARFNLRLHSFILEKFSEKNKKNPEFSRAHLARRMGIDPGRLTRILASPNNWESSTVSDLVLAICGGELSDWGVREFAELSKSTQPSLAATATVQPPKISSGVFKLAALKSVEQPDTYKLPNHPPAPSALESISSTGQGPVGNSAPQYLRSILRPREYPTMGQSHETAQHP